MVRINKVPDHRSEEDLLSGRLRSILPETDGFRVPPDYFDELPSRISARLDTYKPPVHAGSWIPFARHRVAWSAGTFLAAVAALLLIFVVLPGLNREGQELSNGLKGPGGNTAEFIDYVDEPAILDQMGNVNLVLSPEVSEDAIVSYLVDHDVQDDLIKDQLRNHNK